MKLKNLHESRPKARMKKVWNKDEHLGKNVGGTYAAGKPKPYNWSKTGTFHGQSEGYKEHII